MKMFNMNVNAIILCLTIYAMIWSKSSANISLTNFYPFGTDQRGHWYETMMIWMTAVHPRLIWSRSITYFLIKSLQCTLGQCERCPFFYWTPCFKQYTPFCIPVSENSANYSTVLGWHRFDARRECLLSANNCCIQSYRRQPQK